MDNQNVTFTLKTVSNTNWDTETDDVMSINPDVFNIWIHNTELWRDSPPQAKLHLKHILGKQCYTNKVGWS